MKGPYYGFALRALNLKCTFQPGHTSWCDTVDIDLYIHIYNIYYIYIIYIYNILIPSGFLQQDFY